MTEAIGITTGSGWRLEVEKVSVKSALERLSPIRSVNVAFTDASSGAEAATACSSGGVFINIEFKQPGDLPYLSGTTAQLTSGSITVIETRKGDRPIFECSNHGICDRFSGICRCFEGYGASDGDGGIGRTQDCGARLSYIPQKVGPSGGLRAAASLNDPDAEANAEAENFL